MVFDYLALVLLIAIPVILLYGLIAIWSMPYEIAKARHHPHQEAIGTAVWVSLFTLGILWPFLWVWATIYRSDCGWGFTPSTPVSDPSDVMQGLQNRVAVLERMQQEQV